MVLVLVLVLVPVVSVSISIFVCNTLLIALVSSMQLVLPLLQSTPISLSHTTCPQNVAWGDDNGDIPYLNGSPILSKKSINRRTDGITVDVGGVVVDVVLVVVEVVEVVEVRVAVACPVSQSLQKFVAKSNANSVPL